MLLFISQVIWILDFNLSPWNCWISLIGICLSFDYLVTRNRILGAIWIIDCDCPIIVDCDFRPLWELIFIGFCDLVSDFFLFVSSQLRWIINLGLVFNRWIQLFSTSLFFNQLITWDSVD